jgi:hypothetical protein
MINKPLGDSIKAANIAMIDTTILATEKFHICKIDLEIEGLL